MFKDAAAGEVDEYRSLRVQRKGSAWWTDEIKETIEGKRRVYIRKCCKGVWHRR